MEIIFVIKFYYYLQAKQQKHKHNKQKSWLLLQKSNKFMAFTIMPTTTAASVIQYIFYKPNYWQEKKIAS